MGRGSGSFIKKKDRDFILSIPFCMYCGSTEKLTIDHIHPIIKGGNSERINLTRACNRCNCLKTGFYIDVFYHRMFQKRAEEYIKFQKWVGRYTSCIRRNHPIERMMDAWLKLNEARRNHSYYTRIIYSIKNDSHIPKENLLAYEEIEKLQKTA
jgi:hypothetical protein